MEILIANRQDSHPIQEETVRRKAMDILSALDCDDCELSIVITDDPQIAEFNQQYLNRQGPTNVIAFPMRDDNFPDIAPQILGDVVISMDTAEKEAVTAGITIEKRFTELLIHGILHLLGYDHETNEEDAEKMEKKSIELIELWRNW